jgi:methylated-DNA-[protein]-cysteine S-methyltransferase
MDHVNVGQIEYAVFESPLGNMALVSRNGKLVSLDLSDQDLHAMARKVLDRYPRGRERTQAFTPIANCVHRYMKGERVDFDVAVDLSGLGEFTRKALAVLRTVPYGQVRSYVWLGRSLGYAHAARAVGQAVKRNPIPIIIPCHRIIREDGTIGGFSLGGVHVKEQLLRLEGVKVEGLRSCSPSGTPGDPGSHT